MEKAVSSVLAIVGGCLLICVPALLTDFLSRNRNLAIVNPEFRAAFSCFLSDFRVSSGTLNLFFYPIYMFRRLTFAFIIVLLSDAPALQLALILAGSLAVNLHNS
eukprot:TRINITY_DN3306_c0_g1_i1.p1 TRINITY_DN3306_c0_g1~~TRINITY_DN3306_c0_g1_i1.p1  ORF type:complete len:105 (+),score=14.36 TRINITY_DN3306_c0_g1_i1:55-369(+)